MLVDKIQLNQAVALRQDRTDFTPARYDALLTACVCLPATHEEQETNQKPTCGFFISWGRVSQMISINLLEM